MKRNSPRRFRPEVRLLLFCVREQVLDIPDDGSSTSTVGDVDWDTLVDLAYYHRLEHFVRRTASEGNISMPSDVRTNLETASNALTHRNLYMISELVRLLDRLEAAGVRALSYKGPSLAELAYQDVTLRRFGDLDLLVPEDDFESAVDVLCDGNYAVEKSYPTFAEKTLREQDGGMLVDLHSSVTPARYPFTFPFEGLWERRVDVSLFGKTVQTFCPSDLLPILAVHGTRHLWVQLEWLASFAALTQHESVRWPRVLGRSKQIGCDRMVLSGLQLAQELLGLPLPETVSTAVDADWLVRRLSERIISQVVHDDVDPSPENRSFHHERYLMQLLLMRGVTLRVTYGARIGCSLASGRLDR